MAPLSLPQKHWKAELSSFPCSDTGSQLCDLHHPREDNMAVNCWLIPRGIAGIAGEEAGSWTPFVNYSRQNENLNALSNKWLNTWAWELLATEPTAVPFYATAQTCEDSRRATKYIMDILLTLQGFLTWRVTAGLERFSHMCPNPLKPCELNSPTGPSCPSRLNHRVKSLVL